MERVIPELQEDFEGIWKDVKGLCGADEAACPGEVNGTGQGTRYGPSVSLTKQDRLHRSRVGFHFVLFLASGQGLHGDRDKTTWKALA